MHTIAKQLEKGVFERGKSLIILTDDSEDYYESDKVREEIFSGLAKNLERDIFILFLHYPVD